VERACEWVLRAADNGDSRKHGFRYIFGALDVHRDRLYARMRPRRAGIDALGFMRTIRLVYPARPRLYWIQDNLSANWTSEIRAFAANNKIELVPTPTYASYLNRIESHFRPIQEFVFNHTDYPTGTPPSAPSPATSPTATAPTATAESPLSNANTKSPHEQVIFRSSVWVGPTS